MKSLGSSSKLKLTNYYLCRSASECSYAPVDNLAPNLNAEQSTVVTESIGGSVAPPTYPLATTE